MSTSDVGGIPQRGGFDESLPTNLSPRGVAELSQLIDSLDLLDSLFHTPTAGNGGEVSLGRFRILRKLGAGRYGIVFLAEDTQLQRRVVVKVPQPAVLADPEQFARFLREARAAARFEHAGIVPVFETGLDRGLGYLVAGFVAGPTLAEWLTRRTTRPSPRTAAWLVERLAGAVHHAHERGVLHCDLKPANILLDSAESGVESLPDVGCPRVTDFGLARIVADDPSLTRTFQMAGTPLYMSPEQARGDRRVLTPQTDIYSLGVILYELLCGRLPFAGGTLDEILERVAAETPVPLRSVDSSIPRDLETVCLKCLEKNPKKRYESAAKLAADLRLFLDNKPIASRSRNTVQRAWSRCRRNPAIAVTVALVSLGVVFGAVQVSRNPHGVAAIGNGAEEPNSTTPTQAVTLPSAVAKSLTTPSKETLELRIDGTLFVNGIQMHTEVKDIGVDEFGRTVLLHHNGDLHVLGMGSWPGFKSIGFERSSGRLHALANNGELKIYDGPKHLKNEVIGIKDFGVDEYGRVVALSWSGELYLPRFWSLKRYKSLGFERSTGKMWTLSLAGELQIFDDKDHLKNVLTGVREFGIDEYGRVVVLKWSGELCVPGECSWQGYKRLSFERNTGKMFALSKSGELRNLVDSLHWQTTATGIKDFGTDEYGRIVTLQPDGTLSIKGWETWPGYQTIVFEGDSGHLYALQKNGTINRLVSPKMWAVNTTEVKQLGIDEYGRVVILDHSGRLYIPGWYAWGDTKSIVFEQGTGRLHVLRAGGEVDNLRTREEWQTIAKGISEINQDE